MAAPSPRMQTPNNATGSTRDGLTVSPEEKQKYSNIFRNANPVDGFLDGKCGMSPQMSIWWCVGRLWPWCRCFLSNHIGKIEATSNDAWANLVCYRTPPGTCVRALLNTTFRALADVDKTGKLDESRFSIALHLVYKVMDGSIKTLPQSLPPRFTALFDTKMAPSLQTSHMRQGSLSIQQPSSAGMNAQKRNSIQTSQHLGSPFTSLHDINDVAGNIWQIMPDQRAKFDSYFARLDAPRKGFLGGTGLLENGYMLF